MKDWKKLINDTKLKIEQRGKDFSKEEAIIIQNDKELSTLFLKNLNTENTITEDFINLLWFALMKADKKELDQKTLENAIYFYIKSNFQFGYYFSDLIESTITFLNGDKNLQKKLEELEEETFKNPKYLFEKAMASDSFIDKLLEYKREDIIENLPYSYITKKTYQKLKKEYPNCNVVKQYEKENIVSENSTLEDLLQMYYYIDRKSPEKEEKEEILQKEIRKKINQLEDCSNLTGNTGLVFFFNNMEKNQKTELAYQLYKKNNFDYISVLLIEQKITIEELKQKVKELILSHKKISPAILKVVGIDPLQDERIIKLLLDYGYLEFFLQNSQTEDLNDYTPYILEKIKNKDENYQDRVINIDLSLYPEILEAFIENDDIRELDFTIMTLTEELYPLIVKAIEKNQKINIIMNETIPLALLKLLLEKGYHEVIFNNDLINSKTIQIYEDFIIEMASNDVYFASGLIFYNYFQIINNKRIIQTLLKNPIVINQLLARISEKEESIFYTDENFTILKDFFAEKYDLNKEHLISLETHTGPEIIKYIEDKTIQSIINLDEKDFSKLLALFPNTTYTKKDLEASYESLIQYLYNGNNPEDVNIFTNFVHAIQKQDQLQINYLSEKLMIHTRIDFLKKLLKKYHQNDITNIQQLLKKIIEKQNTEEKQHYLNILHDLTNEYISNSRNNYFKNHYLYKKYPQYENMLENLISKIEKNEEKDIASSIQKQLDTKFYQRINSLENENFRSLEEIIERIRENRTKYLPYLNEAVNYYLEKVRNYYQREISLGNSLNLPYTLDEKDQENQLIKYMILNCMSTFTKRYRSLDEEIIRLLKDQLDRETIYECLEYYHSEFRDKTVNEKDLKLVIQTAITFIKNHPDDFLYLDKEEIIKKLDKNYKIKRNYQMNSNQGSILPILANLDLENVKEKLKNKENYQKLLTIMSKYKLHILPNELKELLQECDISDDYSNIASFINSFETILKNNDNKDFTGIAPILVNADIYSSSSSFYSQVLGDQDSKLIRLNPRPNEATEKKEKEERLREAIQLTIQNYKRQKVTIPTFSKKITLPSNKNLEGIVGNFTAPCNLTHGERTGACMRIGGAGESLFLFCLQNENGFHIRFENPKTHEYISRVSGFRNGNTVFLNQLRHSCNKKEYQDEDLIFACQKIAEEIIEQSKNSSYPIENVVIHKDEAMRESNMEKIPLGITDNKKGLPLFYTNIETSGIILATTSKDKPFTPIKLGIKNVPTYKPYRPKPEIITNSKLVIEKINRILTLKYMIEKNQYEALDPINPKDIQYLIATDDWYIYIDEKNEIHYAIIPTDERAIIELQENLKNVNNLIQEKQKKEDNKSYGI